MTTQDWAISGGLPPELDIERQTLRRRQAIAEAMMAAGQQTPQGRMVGRYYVAPSPLEGAANLLSTFSGHRQMQDVDRGMKDLGTRYNEGLADAVRRYSESATTTTPAIEAPPDEIGGGPGREAMTTPADPRTRVAQALASPYAPVRQLGMLDYQTSQQDKTRADQRDFQAQQAQLQREQRMQDLQIRLQDARTSAAEKAALQREMAQMRLDAQKEMMQAQLAGRQDMARLAASLRPAPQPRQQQVVQTDSGPMILGPDGTAQPIVGPDGQPVKPKGTEKALPASAAKGLLENQQNLRRAQQAVKLISGEDITDDKGAVLQQGDKQATGKKAFLTTLGAPGDYLLNKIDPKGVDARAAVGDLGSIVIHDRSGAAVTAAEYPRLRPFIPQATDAPEVAKRKAQRFAQEYERIQQETADFYRESGYKVPAESLKPTSGPPKPGPAGTPPTGVDPKLWNVMTAEERALWQKN